jgi:LysM repeat protein
MNLITAKNEGVNFTIIRGMYGNVKDTSFESNYSKAKNSGLGVGVYWWTRAVNEAQAREEAQILINTCLKGKQFEYPIYIDVEDSLLANLGKSKVDAIITSALTTLENAGYYAGFYMNKDWYYNKCNGSALAKRFTLWLAAWTSTEQNAPMWQFGGETNYIRSNKIAGIVCDQDYCYIDFPHIIKQAGLNGFGKSSNTGTTTKKSFDEIANEIIQGKWGNGNDRKARLQSAGYTNNDISSIQSIVNKKLGVNQPTYYTVVKNDNLTKIAKKYNVSWQSIANLNNIKAPYIIYPGQKLRIK